jgi:signal transduction histidine kinase
MRHARFGNAGSLPGAALRTRLALLALLALLVAGMVLTRPWAVAGTVSGREVASVTEWHVSTWDATGRRLGDADGIPATASTPTTLHGLTEGDIVELTANVESSQRDVLYLSTFYAPFTAWMDGSLVTSYGEGGTYPGFLACPPPASRCAQVGGGTGSHTLRIRYTVPSGRTSLRLADACVGSPDAMRRWLFGTMGTQTFFAITMGFIGLALLVASRAMATFRLQSQTFAWVGLLNIFVSLWSFGESNLTCLLIPRPSLLHFVAYLGLYAMPIPLAHLTSLIEDDPTGGRLFRLSCGATELFAPVAVALQLLGLVQFSRSILTFFALFFLTHLVPSVWIAVQALRRREARRLQLWYLAVMFLYDLFLLLELLNYYVWLVVPEMTFTLVGSVLFVALTMWMSLMTVRDTTQSAQGNEELHQQVELMRVRDEARDRQLEQISRTSSEMRRQRHDMRHMLAAIRSYNDQGDREGLDGLVRSLDAHIPTPCERTYCDNLAVNSVVGYYADLARERGLTEVDIALDVPAGLPRDVEDDLCSIVGNLLENAVAALDEVMGAGGDPWIRMRGLQRSGKLVITLDNTYQCVRGDGFGGFSTTKREGSGIGLRSVETCARRNGGSARFEASDGVFASSVYLALSTTPPEKGRP